MPQITRKFVNSSGIYRLQCKTCSKLSVSQIGRPIEIRHSEHIRYIKTNNPVSTYALNFLNNRHKYVNPEYTIQLLKACAVVKLMNCWESFYMHALQQNLLIDEQKSNEPNPLYAVVSVTKYVTRLETHPDSTHTGPT